MGKNKLLILADDAIRRITAFAVACCSEMLLFDAVIQIINDTPEVDAVEVVRCEHCECNDRTDNDKRHGIVWCKKICRYMKADGFCSEGKRRTQ